MLLANWYLRFGCLLQVTGSVPSLMMLGGLERCYVKSHISHSTLIIISSVTLWGLYANENSLLPTFAHCDRLWYKSLMCFRLIKITPSNLLLCQSHICRVSSMPLLLVPSLVTGSPCFPGAFCVALTQCKKSTCQWRLLCSWNFPGKYTGVDSHSLLQGIFLT